MRLKIIFYDLFEPDIIEADVIKIYSTRGVYWIEERSYDDDNELIKLECHNYLIKDVHYLNFGEVKNND